LSIPLYLAFKTFEIINTFLLQEHAFVLKDVKSLKSLPSNPTNTMSQSIIDKYIKRPNSLFNLFLLLNFFANHDMVNVNKKRYKSHIIFYVLYNEHHDLIFYLLIEKKIIIYLFIFCNHNIIKGHHSTWHNVYNMHEKKSLVKKKRSFCKYNTHTMN